MSMRVHAEEVLRQIDAVEFAEKLVGEMSAGQQRRIMIGRALVWGRRGCCCWMSLRMLWIWRRRLS